MLRGRELQDHDLEDFTQETLMAVIARLESFRGDSRFVTWVLAVATRVAFGALRRRRVQVVGGSVFERLEQEARAFERDPAATPLERATGDDLLAALRQVIRTELTDRQRRAVLGELRGLPTPELARHLGTNPNALYKLHHDARRKLRAALEARGFGVEDLDALRRRTLGDAP